MEAVQQDRGELRMHIGSLSKPAGHHPVPVRPALKPGAAHDPGTHLASKLRQSAPGWIAVALLAMAPVAWARQPPPVEHAIPQRALDATAPATTMAELAKARPVTAKHAMVVSAQHLATQAGVDILKQGGNAIDAAVAVGYALAVVHPCCGNIGGGGFMLVHLADGQSVFLDFREKAPLKATPTHVSGCRRQRDQGQEHRHLAGRRRARHGDGTGCGVEEVRHDVALPGDGAGDQAGQRRLRAARG
jgi:hypothetical protein